MMNLLMFFFFFSSSFVGIQGPGQTCNQLLHSLAAFVRSVFETSLHIKDRMVLTGSMDTGANNGVTVTPSNSQGLPTTPEY
jgi:hypothetical protein